MRLFFSHTWQSSNFVFSIVEKNLVFSLNWKFFIQHKHYLLFIFACIFVSNWFFSNIFEIVNITRNFFDYKTFVANNAKSSFLKFLVKLRHASFQIYDTLSNNVFQSITDIKFDKYERLPTMTSSAIEQLILSFKLTFLWSLPKHYLIYLFYCLLVFISNPGLSSFIKKILFLMMIFVNSKAKKRYLTKNLLLHDNKESEYWNIQIK